MRTTTKPSAFYGLRYVYIAVNILIPPQHYRSCLLSCSQCSYEMYKISANKRNASFTAMDVSDRVRTYRISVVLFFCKYENNAKIKKRHVLKNDNTFGFYEDFSHLTSSRTNFKFQNVNSSMRLNTESGVGCSDVRFATRIVRFYLIRLLNGCEWIRFEKWSSRN